MRIFHRENQLPLQGKGYDLICPSCGAEYVNEGQAGFKVTCPNCATSWRVDTNGRPKL